MPMNRARGSARLGRIARAPALRRALLGLLLLIVAVGLFGRFGLPPILAYEAKKWVAEKLHRTLAM
jgi:hypothetical protein